MPPPTRHPPRRDGILVAGGGLAARRACATLRREGYAGRLVCGEPHLPYDRPPLSKEENVSTLRTIDAARELRRALRPDAPGVGLSSFWTDQHGLRIQYLGDARRADGLSIDGDPDDRSFTAVFTRAATPIAAVLVDRPRSLPAIRTLLSDAGPAPAGRP